MLGPQWKEHVSKINKDYQAKIMSGISRLSVDSLDYKLDYWIKGVAKLNHTLFNLLWVWS